MYKFEGTIKSVVKNGVVEFYIEPTSQYSIKGPNGKDHFVAFDEAGENLFVIQNKKLKFQMCELKDDGVRNWFSAHADSGRAVEFKASKRNEILNFRKA